MYVLQLQVFSLSAASLLEPAPFDGLLPSAPQDTPSTAIGLNVYQYEGSGHQNGEGSSEGAGLLRARQASPQGKHEQQSFYRYIVTRSRTVSILLFTEVLTFL